MFAMPGRGLRAKVPGDRVSPGEIAFTVCRATELAAIAA